MTNTRRQQIRQYHKQGGDHMQNVIMEYSRCLSMYAEQAAELEATGQDFSEEFTTNGELLSMMLESLQTLMETHNDLAKVL